MDMKDILFFIVTTIGSLSALGTFIFDAIDRYNKKPKTKKIKK